MSKLEQMRKATERLINIDRDIGTVTRNATVDNGRGQLVPTGEFSEHKTICRVGYVSGGVWSTKPWEGGLTTAISPFALARFDADIKQGDTLTWRGRKYSVGVVTRSEGYGGFVSAQAPLTEVK